jgi:hypothetical protein
MVLDCQYLLSNSENPYENFSFITSARNFPPRISISIYCADVSGQYKTRLHVISLQEYRDSGIVRSVTSKDPDAVLRNVKSATGW